MQLKRFCQEQVSGSYLMDEANDQSIITLNGKPAEQELDNWVAALCDTLDARIREKEIAADQFCWRLTINNQHWLLFYSEICDAVWLQALEEMSEEVIKNLRHADYI